MLGVVNLDKPVGPTSHDMVGLMRRLTGTRRIGHAGTLDPLASGVLPILVGAATRFSEELTGGRKRYDAVIRLGQASATDDCRRARSVPVDAPLPSREAVEEALAGFVGTFEQRPPAFSARKLAGRTAYRAARAGEPIDLPPRTVTVDSIELLDLNAGDGWLDVRIDLRCGTGTYIRSIARDLGERLGTGAHLHALRRTEAAGLRVGRRIHARAARGAGNPTAGWARRSGRWASFCRCRSCRWGPMPPGASPTVRRRRSRTARPARSRSSTRPDA